MEHVARFEGRLRYRGVVATEWTDEVTSLTAMRAASDGYLELVGDDGRVLQRVAVWSGALLDVPDGARVAAGARIAAYAHAEYRDRPFQHLRSGGARVAALLAARHPRHRAVLAPIGGRATVDGVGARRRVRIEADDGATWQRTLGRRLERWWEGDRVDAGDALTDGERDHHALLRLWGRERFERHLAEELAEVLSTASPSLAPNTIDLIVREAIVDTPDGPRLRPLREFPPRDES